MTAPITLVGSYVISEVGRLIGESNVLPKGSVPARFGGDEYVIACPAESISAGEDTIARKLQGFD
jgi:GGDEF domain-containing protein